MNEEEKKALEEALDKCECSPLELTVQPERTTPDVFKDYTTVNLLRDTMRQHLLQAGMPPDFLEASDHDFYCRCDKCKEWWRTMGPEEEGTFGPFSREEIMGA
jgi:hypothetical protein